MTRNKIPIELVKIENKIETSMDLDDFENMNIGMEKHMGVLKKDFEKLMVKTTEQFHNIAKLSTTKRWLLCKKLSDFVIKYNRFEIMNFSKMCANHMGLDPRNFRLFVLFGSEFVRTDIKDSIPYYTYSILLLKKTKLDELGIFEAEKTRVIKNNIHLDYKKYTEYLNTLNIV